MISSSAHWAKQTAIVIAIVSFLTMVQTDSAGLSAMTIGEARQLPNGTSVTLVDKIVTQSVQGMFGGRYYIQEPDRSSGIAVLLTTNHLPGTTVTVTGVIGQSSTERVIQQASETVTGSVTPPRPLGITNEQALNPMTEGLFVTVWGRVEAVFHGPVFRLDDGSDVRDSGNNLGLRVNRTTGFFAPPLGSYVVAKGVRGIVPGVFGNLPIVHVRNVTDMTVLQSSPPAF